VLAFREAPCRRNPNRRGSRRIPKPFDAMCYRWARPSEAMNEGQELDPPSPLSGHG